MSFDEFLEAFFPRFLVLALTLALSYLIGFVLIGVILNQPPGSLFGKIWFGSWLLLGLYAAYRVKP